MDNEQNQNKNSRIIDVDLQNEMRKSFLDYSMSVIVSRALPDVRDGLKPVHRRILYTMNQIGLDPSKPYHKCADTVGQVLGSYHPHGDASVYDAMVRLAQDFSMRYMLVDGHGNFGSVDGDPPAAYRYTEARMSKISLEMLTDIEKNTVDFMSNYDDRLKEPTVLPSRFPNLLVNGSSGIAVGMATEIPPHNLGETIDAVCTLIDNPDAELAEIMECMPGPDFPTGGIIMGRSGIRAAYATGRGKITVRAKTEIIEAKNGRYKIIVTELPYKVNKARLIENIADLVKDKRIEGISNIEDHSDRKGEPRQLEIVKEEIMQIRNKYADPRRTEICAVSGEVDIEDLIPQEECVLTLTQFGYVKRLSADTYKIQRRGGRGVSGMSRREEDIAAEMFVINSHDYVLFFTDKGRVYRLKCYEVPEGSRQSKGVNIANLIPISPDEKVTSMIRVPEFDEEKYLVMVTRQGIIKRIELNAYNTSRKGGLIALELNEGDELAWVRMTDGNSQVIIATKKGMAIRFNETDIRAMGRQARGVKAMALKEGDCVVGMSVVREGGLVLTVSETGYGRLSSPDDYRVQSRGGKGLTNYHTEKYGDVAAIKVVNLDDDIIIISEEGIIIRIAAESIRVCARPSKGVTVMKVNGDDRVVTIARVPHIDGEDDESAESEDNAENGEPSEAVAEEVSENNEGETSDSTEENTEE